MVEHSRAVSAEDAGSSPAGAVNMKGDKEKMIEERDVRGVIGKSQEEVKHFMRILSKCQEKA